MSPIEEARKLCEEARLLRRSLAETIADFRTFRTALRADDEGRGPMAGEVRGRGSIPASGSRTGPTRSGAGQREENSFESKTRSRSGAARS